ncbi:MAG: AI-2E family transporter [Nocardioides sp.]
MSQVPGTPAGRLPRATVVLLSMAALVLVVAGLRSASGIVGPMVLAVVLTVTVHPLRGILQRRRVPVWAASTAVLLTVYLALTLLTLALVVSVGRLAVLLPTYADSFNATVASVADWLAARGVGSEQVRAIADAVDVGKLVGIATSVLSSVLGILSELFFIATLLLFLAFDATVTGRLAQGLALHRPHLVEAFTSFARGTRSYVAVSTVFGLAVAVVDMVALMVMNVPGAFVWGVLAFVTNFIPNIGFVVGLVPPALIALLDGGIGLMLAVVIVYSVANVVIQTVIQPRIVGNAVGMTATLTFVSLIFWSWVIGPIGALMAVPLTLLVKAFMVDADPSLRWLDPIISGRRAEDR